MSPRGLIVVVIALGLAACTGGGSTNGSGTQGNGHNVTGTSSIGAPAIAPARVPPSQVLRALQQLDNPGTIKPLPGSVPSELVTGEYTTGKSCSAVRAAYRNPSTLPHGAHASAGPGGVVLVSDQVGDQDGIVTLNRPKHGCAYTIADQPTVQAGGHGPVPAGAFWGSVGCGPPGSGFPKGLAAAAFTGAGKPWIAFLGPANSNATSAAQAAKYAIDVAQETLAQATRSGDSGRPPGTQYPATVQYTDGVFAVKLGGAGAGQTLTLACTVEFGQLTNLFGGPPR